MKLTKLINDNSKIINITNIKLILQFKKDIYNNDILKFPELDYRLKLDIEIPILFPELDELLDGY